MTDSRDGQVVQGGSRVCRGVAGPADCQPFLPCVGRAVARRRGHNPRMSSSPHPPSGTSISCRWRLQVRRTAQRLPRPAGGAPALAQASCCRAMAKGATASGWRSRGTVSPASMARLWAWPGAQDLGGAAASPLSTSTPTWATGRPPAGFDAGLHLLPGFRRPQAGSAGTASWCRRCARAAC